MRRPVIIEAAINGTTKKSRNPNVPRTVDEIVGCGLECLTAGAAIVHNHTDAPELEPSVHSAEPYLEAYPRILERAPDAILYPTMSGAVGGISPARRYEHVEALEQRGLLRMAPIDPGSLNLGPCGADGLPVDSDFVYVNSFADVRYMVGWCRDRGLGATISVFEPGFLRLALAYHAAGLLPVGTQIKLYFGGARRLFGFPPSELALDAYVSLLADTGLPWSVAVLGGDVLETIAEAAVRRGGHLRVGLEDYGGPDQPSNVELIRRAVSLIERLGCRPASAAEAHAILGLRDPKVARPGR